MAQNELELLLKLGVRDTERAVADVRLFRTSVEKELKAITRTAEAEAKAQARAQVTAAQMLARSRQNASENVITALGGGRALLLKELASDLVILRKEAAETGGILNALSNRFGAGTIAVGAMAGAVIGLTALTAAAAGGLLILLKHAAESAGKFHDLSIETGLSVETLSGLELQLKQSGASLENLSTSTFELQKRLASAADGNKKLGATFAALGLKDTAAALRDTDASFRQVLSSLAAISDEGRRNAVGAEVMGKSYKQLRVFIAEAGGSIDKVIEKARAAGLVLSKEAAEAADQFADAMDELSLRADRLTTQIGSALIPELLKLFRVLTNESQNAGSVIGFVANSIGASFRNATNEILVMIAAIKTAVESRALLLTVTGPSGVIGAAQALRGSFDKNLAEVIGAAHKPGPVTPKPAGGGFSRSGGGGGGGAGMSAEDTAKRLREIELERVRAVSDATIAAEKYLFEQRSIARRELTATEIAEAQKVLDQKLKNLKAEEEEARKLPARERQVRLAEIEKERLEAGLDFNAKRRAATAEADAEEFEAAKAHRQSILKLQETADDAELARIAEHVQRGNMTFERAERERTDLLQASFRRREAELEEQLREAGANLEQRRAIEDQLDQLYEEEQAAADEAHRKIREAVRQTTEAYREYYEAIHEVYFEINRVNREVRETELRRARFSGRGAAIEEGQQLERRTAMDDYQRRVFEVEAARSRELEKASEEQKLVIEQYYNALRIEERKKFYTTLEEIDRTAKERLAETDPLSLQSLFGGELAENIELTGSVLEGLAETSAAVFAQMSADAGNFGTIATGAVQGFTRGLSQMLETYILTGKTGPAVLRRLTAEVLAQIAVQAAVKAIFELAQGFAMLFVNPAAAASHFKAAALFGAAAAAAGVAGRKVAGDLFNQGGAGGGTDEASTYETDRQRRDREAASDRTRREERGGPVEVVIHAPQSWVEANAIAAYRSGGPLRTTIRGDLGLEMG